jgi:histidinol-phosphate aminotransferase
VTGCAVARKRIATIRVRRERVASALRDIALVREVLPSQANFLAVRFHDVQAAWQRLLDAGVVVRDVRRYRGLGDALRVTIGTPTENARMLAALRGAAA